MKSYLLIVIFLVALFSFTWELNKKLNLLPNGTLRTNQISLKYLIGISCAISVAIILWLWSLLESIATKEFLIFSISYSVLLLFPLLIEFTLRSAGLRPNLRIDMFEQSFGEWSSIEPHKHTDYVTPEFHQQYIEHFRRFKPKFNGLYFVPTGSTDGSIVVRDDFRLTVDNPKRPESTIHILGGSTTFCAQTPNDFTYASILQKMFNADKDNVRVLNYGFSGATLPRLVERLVHSEVKSSDSVIVFFGINEAAHIMINKQTEITKPFGRIPRFEEFVTRFATISLVFEWLVNIAVKQKYEIQPNLFLFESALNQLITLTAKTNSSLFLVIQPNIFTKRSRTDYEERIVEASSREYLACFNRCYELFENLCQTKKNSRIVFASAVSIFDNVESSPYLDSFHVNGEGNELIAKFLYDVTKDN